MSIFERYPDLTDPEYVEAYDLDRTYTKSHKEGPILDLDVAVALIRTEGNVSKVAEILHRSRRVMDTYISRDVAMTELLEDLEESFLDAVIAKTRDLAKAGDPATMRFVLGTLGKKRGFVTRVEATGKDGADLNVMFYLPENGREAPPAEDA